MIRRFPRFTYIDWIKERMPLAKIFLAGSGIPHIHPADFGLDLRGLDLEIEDLKGHQPFLETVAQAYACRADEVLGTPSCTYANYVALRTLLRPGDHAVVETPSYELLHRQVALAGATCTKLRRRREDAYRIDFERLVAALQPRTRAIVLTSPHNPSGVRLTDSELDRLSDIAREHDLDVVIDEVYLDSHLVGDRPSHYATDRRIVATSGMTKVYGIGNLRVGWVLAAPELVREMHLLNEFIADRISAYAVEVAMTLLTEPNRSAVREISTDFRRRHLPIVHEFVETCPQVSLFDVGRGINLLFVLNPGLPSAESVCEQLIREDGVLMVPGEMFEEPGVIRLSLSCSEEDLRQGLACLARRLRG